MKTSPRARLLLILLPLLFCASCSAARQDEPQSPPNVLFISIDDLNDWVGVMGGHPQAITPNIDRLAARGVLFTNAHTAAPSCNPSRVAVMTGLRPSTTGVYHNLQPMRLSLPDVVTLPQHFRNNGYVTLGAGKLFHNDYPDPPSWDAYFPSPEAHIPEESITYREELASGIPLNEVFHSQFDWGVAHAPLDETGDALVAGWVVEQLRAEHDRPFFLGCGIYRPHQPWYVPRKFFDLYPVEDIVLPEVLDTDLEDVPPIGRRLANQLDNPHGDHRVLLKYDRWRHAVQGYLASLSYADAMVGRVLDALDASPYRDNTIVVLWTDHGWHLGEKLHWRKSALWEETTRTPLIVMAPGVGPQGGRSGRTVSLLDIYPTLVDLCGLPAPERLDGDSLRPLLEDLAAEWGKVALTTYGRENHAVRDERWRYIRYCDGTEELYDHEADPLEWEDLATDERFAEVKQRLAASLPATNAPDATLDPEKVRRRGARISLQLPPTAGEGERQAR